jgi:hypothetical protein
VGVKVGAGVLVGAGVKVNVAVGRGVSVKVADGIGVLLTMAWRVWAAEVSVAARITGSGVSVVTTGWVAATVAVAGVTSTENMAVKVRSGVAKLSVGSGVSPNPQAAVTNIMTRIRVKYFCRFFI